MGTTARALRADGEATYKRILEAAGELFAETGFAETTNKAIAASASVDLASINYHFGNRAGLYNAVLAEAHRRLIDIQDLQQIAGLALSAHAKLRKLIERLVDSTTGQKSWYVRVLGREVLSPSSSLRTLEREEILPKIQIMLSVLGEITGIPASDPALLRCMLSVAAPCSVLLIAGRSLSPVVEMIIHTPREILVDHLYNFAIGGLERIAVEYRATR